MDWILYKMDQYTSVFNIVKTNEVLKLRIKQLEIELLTREKRLNQLRLDE